jgi:hypothetical protein
MSYVSTDYEPTCNKTQIVPERETHVVIAKVAIRKRTIVEIPLDEENKKRRVSSEAFIKNIQKIYLPSLGPPVLRVKSR